MKIKEFINKIFGRKENSAKNRAEEESIQKQLEQLKAVMKGSDDMRESEVQRIKAEAIADKLNDCGHSFIVPLKNMNKAFEKLGEQVEKIETKLFSPVQAEVARLEKIMNQTKNSRIKKKLAKRIEQLKTESK